MTKFLKKFRIVLLLSIVLVAIVLRFYKLSSNPPSLNWDETSIGYNAYSILKTGADEYGNKLPLSFRSFDDYKPPVYIYLTVPSVAIFGLNELAVRLPAALLGTIAVLVVYFFARELLSSLEYNKRESIALLSALFLAISPWHLQFSRAAYEGNIGIFFLILACFCFLKGLKNEKYYLAFCASFILSIYSYHSFRLINPLILVALFALFFRSINKVSVFLICSTVLIIIFSAPIYLSFLGTSQTAARLSMVTVFSDPNIQMKSAINVEQAKKNHDLIGQVINNRRLIFIPTIFKGYFDHFNFDFLFLHGDGGVQHHAYNMGMLYLWDLPFVLLGIYFLLKKFDRRISLLFLIFFLAPLPSSITTGTPHPVRAIAAIPAFQIFSAAGLVFLMSLFSGKNKRYSNLVFAVILFLLVLNVTYYLYSYYVLTPVKYGYFWQYGNKQAVEYARTHENEYNKIIMSYKYDQPYIYYLFYNKIDPAWYQKNWDWRKNGQVDRFFRVIGKYEFRNIDYAKDSARGGTLLIGTGEEIPNNVNFREIIKFPDGLVAYKIVGT